MIRDREATVFWMQDGEPYSMEDAIPQTIAEKIKEQLVERGGAGSGHHGHEGRPGERGGSAPGGGGPVLKVTGGTRRRAVQKVVDNYASEMGWNAAGLRITDDPAEVWNVVGDRVIESQRQAGTESSEEMIRQGYDLYLQQFNGMFTFTPEALIYVSPESPNPAQTAGHEMGHAADNFFNLTDTGVDEPPENDYKAFIRNWYQEQQVGREYRADLLAGFAVNPDAPRMYRGRREGEGPADLDRPLTPAEVSDMNKLVEHIRTQRVERAYEDSPAMVAIVIPQPDGTFEVLDVPAGEAGSAMRLEDLLDDAVVERGGAGSGHHGHEGRPGERGGSQPGEGGGAERPPGLRSAAELLSVPRTPRWQPVRDAAEAINAVHGLPSDLRAVKVVEVKFGTQRLGRLIVQVNRATGEVTVRNLGVQLPREGENKVGMEEHAALTTAHEFGHYLDWTVFRTQSQPSGDWGNMVGRPQQGSRGLWYEGNGGDTLSGVMTAIKESDAYGQLEHFQSVTLPWPGDDSGAKLVYDYETTRYLREPEELFARGYAQWIAERSGNEDMLRGVDNYREAARVGHAPQAWEPEDFEPIGKAFDALFQNKGLR
jgi:hypothetical protein